MFIYSLIKISALFRLCHFSYPDRLIHFVSSASLSSRRSCHEYWASLSLDHSRRVAFSVRYALNRWRVVQGLARCLSRHSHCNPSQAEQNRTEPNLNAWVVRSSTDASLYLFSYPDSLLHSDRSASLSTCHVASLLSWVLSVAFVGSRCVAFCVRYALNKWRVVQGLARRLRHHSHCNSSDHSPQYVHWHIHHTMCTHIFLIQCCMCHGSCLSSAFLWVDVFQIHSWFMYSTWNFMLCFY